MYPTCIVPITALHLFSSLLYSYAQSAVFNGPLAIYLMTMPIANVRLLRRWACPICTCQYALTEVDYGQYWTEKPKSYSWSQVC